VSIASKQKEKAPTLNAPGPGLLDGLDDIGSGKPSPSKPSAVDVAKHPDAANRLRVLQDMVLHVSRIREVAQLYVSGQLAPPVDPVFPKLGDPDFGPWFGFEAMPSAKDKPNVLAAYQQSGIQHWQYADQWQVFGPFQIGEAATEALAMPPVFHVAGIKYLADQDLIARRHGTPPTLAIEPDKAFIQWQNWPVEVATGMLRPPPWLGRPNSGYGGIGPGAERTSWFAATEIHCDQAGEYWVATGVDDEAQLWINDRLVAAWPSLLARTDLESPIMFRHTFQKGLNRVLVRVRQHRRTTRAAGPSGFWLRVCVRGGPMLPADVAKRAAVASTAKALKAFPDNVRGWRNNRQGVWPDATPPTAWDVEQGINIRWQTGQLPMSISSPLVMGDLVLSACHPHFLMAFDKNTGELRWRGSLDILELLAPDQAPRSAAIWDEIIALQKARFPANGSVYGEPRTSVTVDGKTMTVDEAWSRIRDLSTEWSKLAAKPITDAGQRIGFGWDRLFGLAPATPVTDGKHVWLWSHHGAVACFDMQGKRQWLVKVRHQSSAYDSMSSPLLVDGKLILETVPDDTKPGGYFMRSVVLVALDAATGNPLWQAPVYDPGGAGSATAMRLTNGKEEMTVLITAASGTPLKPAGKSKSTNTVKQDGEVTAEDIEKEEAGSGANIEATLGGTVVRVEDGKVLIPNLSVTCSFGTPVVVGDVVYHCGPMMQSATQLIMIDRDTVGAKRLWTKGHPYGFEPSVSPLDGYLYGNFSSAGSAGGQGNDDRCGYGVLRADNGELLPKHVNVSWPQYAGGNNRQYVPTAVAGRFMFCADSGEGFGGKGSKFANCTVMTATPQPRIIAQSGLPPTTSAGLEFDGDRIYYRKDNALICIGYTGDAGKAFEARENARQILDDFPSAPPALSEAVTVKPFLNYPDLVDRVSMWLRFTLPVYSYGPVNDDQSAMLLKAFTSGEAPRFPHGSVFEIGLGEQRFKWGKIGDGGIEMGKLVSRHRYRVLHPGAYVHELRLGGKQGFLYLYHVMSCDRDRTVRFNVDNPKLGARMWLNGVPLQNQGRYRLGTGDYGLLTEMKITAAIEVPENAPEWFLDTYFTESADDARKDVADYQATLAWAKPYLERVIQLAPDSDEAQRARDVLGRK
jgi:outer membrane protein assembly factor BamB